MAEKKKGTFWKDFKAFITRGNVIDMAVGVVIGGSFGKIVTGLVNYIINPFVGMFIKSGSLDGIKTVITPAVVNAETGAIETAEVAILWGTWLQTIMDFIITAFCIFVVLRILMRAKNTLEHKKMLEAEAAAEAAKADADRKAAEAAAAAPAFCFPADIKAPPAPHSPCADSARSFRAAPSPRRRRSGSVSGSPSASASGTLR